MNELVDYVESLLRTDSITFKSQLEQVGEDLMSSSPKCDLRGFIFDEVADVTIAIEVG